MKKIGLALSGGGFRATLYHLGLVRFLRDAGILPSVTHITSVSGGSIIAAHLALNWGCYNGSPSEFDAAAAELLSFVHLDVRNRIIRRFALCLPWRWVRRLLGFSNRKLTRTGLLEYFYQRHLFGDTSLFQLPECPQLHILTTNLSEGCLCSFNRNGLWMMRRQPGQTVRIDRIHTGLATVPMAVTASSAFPGFFPPLHLTAADVGATGGDFGRQAYTDGGVFDNLGIRMFRFLQPVMEKENSVPDGVLVSDVGKPLVIQSDNRAGGLVRTAMRSSDILMDRVGQLENETFQDAPGFVFTRITDVVDPSGDPTALHPEVQRQAAYIRTDLDRFSDLEVSSLIRHGYCVGRKVAQAHPELFGDELPASPPWDPTPEARAEASAVAMASSLPGSNREPTAVTREARALQGSALRRIWSTLLDYRDWTSYVYVPILVPLLVLTPYFVFKSYQRSHRVNQLVESLAQGGRDVEIMSKLLEGPVRSIVGERPEEIPNSAIVDSKGFLILQDSRVIDLRGWKPAPGGRTEEGSLVYGYRRLRVLKEPENKGNDHFVTKVLASSPESVVHFPQQELKPKLSVRHLEDSQTGLKQALCEVHVDFQKVPPGEPIDVMYEHISPGEFLRQGTGATTLAFDVDADTAELIRWLLLPEDKQYQKWRMIRYPQGNPAAAESVRVVTEFLAEDSTILAFKLLSLKGGYTYEITWIYR